MFATRIAIRAQYSSKHCKAGIQGSCAAWDEAMRTTLRRPREPSVIGIMLFSVLLVLATSDPPIEIIVVSMLTLVLHMLSFDLGFDAARRRDVKTLLAVAAVNISPYGLVAAAKGFTMYIPGAVLALLLLLLATTAYWVNPKSPWAYVVGSIVPTLPALSIISTYLLDTRLIILWAFYAVYVVATAAYIESRLPYRNYNPWISTALWALAIPLAYTYNPPLLIATIEPTIRYIHNSVRGPFKVSRNEIKKLGKKELSNMTLFSFLTILLAML
jgi:uncharacterized membrane protein YecN with MAPEG domain